MYANTESTLDESRELWPWLKHELPGCLANTFSPEQANELKKSALSAQACSIFCKESERANGIVYGNWQLAGSTKATAKKRKIYAPLKRNRNRAQSQPKSNTRMAHGYARARARVIKNVQKKNYTPA